jgi:hypothetical protein
MKGSVVRGASIVTLTLALCAFARQQQDRSMEMDFQNPPEAAMSARKGLPPILNGCIVSASAECKCSTVTSVSQDLSKSPSSG